MTLSHPRFTELLCNHNDLTNSVALNQGFKELIDIVGSDTKSQLKEKHHAIEGKLSIATKNNMTLVE